MGWGGVSVLPGAAVAALWLFLGGRLLAWQQIAGSLFSSATEGTPPTRHGNLQPTHKQVGGGSFFKPANDPSADASAAAVVSPVPAAGRPPAAAGAPGSSAADSPSSGSADPAGPAGGWPRHRERTPVTRRPRRSRSPPWRDGRARRYAKPEAKKRSITQKTGEHTRSLSSAIKEDVRGVWQARSRWPWDQS